MKQIMHRRPDLRMESNELSLRISVMIGSHSIKTSWMCVINFCRYFVAGIPIWICRHVLPRLWFVYFVRSRLQPWLHERRGEALKLGRGSLGLQWLFFCFVSEIFMWWIWNNTIVNIFSLLNLINFLQMWTTVRQDFMDVPQSFL